MYSILSYILLWVIVINLNIGCDYNSADNEDNNQVEEEWITIRVLTYNIYHGETTNGNIDMDLFSEIINEQDPDLVALQEVDNRVARSDYLDITKELSDRTGLGGYFVKFRDYKGGEYGAAILSKYTVEEIDMLEAHSTKDRSLPFAKVKISDDKFIYFNSSHLSTNAPDRRAQTKQIAEYYNKNLEQAPLIIAGDLNAEPDSYEMQILLEDFEVSDKELNNTFSTRTGMRKKIDFVLYPDNENWEVDDVKRVCRVDASDHCALLSVLKYKLN